MTSPTSATWRHNAGVVSALLPPPLLRGRENGFTLIELLVVTLIIAILAGILIPTVTHVYRNGRKTREAMDIQAIEMALDAYYADFHAYPRVSHPIAMYTPGTTGTTGADVLGWALIGPGPAVQDQLDGPGFRTVAGGKIYKPYLPPDTMMLDPQLTAGVPSASTAIMDKLSVRPLDIAGSPATNLVMKAGHHTPILYYCAAPVMPNINVAVTGAPAGTGPFITNSNIANAPLGLWDYADNSNETDLTPQAFATILGDANNDGVVDAVNATTQEKPSWKGPYILWSAGPDGIFGLDANGKTDDVTNFDIPDDLRK